MHKFTLPAMAALVVCAAAAQSQHYAQARASDLGLRGSQVVYDMVLAAGTTVAATPAPVTPPPPPLSDASFVSKATIAGLFEVETSKLALAKVTKPELKQFAQTMIDDHSAANDELKALVTKGQVTGVKAVPKALDAEHQKKLDELKAAEKGLAFDQKYHQLQLEGHSAAVDLFTQEATGGQDAELKQWAAKTLPKLKEHKTHIENLKPLPDAVAGQ